MREYRIALDGDGSYDSDECIALLRQSDVVVTNPPFSLFRPYIACLTSYCKRFLIIGSLSAVTYREFFPFLRREEVWTGTGYIKEFIRPDGTLQKFGNIVWYTNLDHESRHRPLELTRTYDPALYPRYDNYDAIEVSRVADIPIDYRGTIGVPISYVTSHNPEEHIIIGLAKRSVDAWLSTRVYTKDDCDQYGDLNAGPVIKVGGGWRTVFPRVLIRRRSG